MEAAFQNLKPELWAALGPLLGSGSAWLLVASLGRLQAYGLSRENTTSQSSATCQKSLGFWKTKNPETHNLETSFE